MVIIIVTNTIDIKNKVYLEHWATIVFKNTGRGVMRGRGVLRSCAVPEGKQSLECPDDSDPQLPFHRDPRLAGTSLRFENPDHTLHSSQGF